MDKVTKYKLGFSVATVAAGLTIAVIASVGSTMGVATAKPPTAAASAQPVATATPVAPAPATTDAVVTDPIQFISSLWSTHYKTRFTLGSSGIAATLAGASANGEEIPTDLIGDFEASGVAVLRRWNLQVASGGRVVAEATFTETSRTPLVGVSNTAADLQANKITSFDRFVVSGYSRNAAGEVRDLFGIVAEVRKFDGSTSVAFTPMGGAADVAGAVDGASKFTATFASAPVTPSGPVTQDPVAKICLERWKTCIAAAELRRQACLKNVLAQTLVCAAACPAASIACGPFYPACLVACEAACISYEAIAMSACNDVAKADRLQCDQAYRDCIRNGGK